MNLIPHLPTSTPTRGEAGSGVKISSSWFYPNGTQRIGSENSSTYYLTNGASRKFDMGLA